MENNYKDLLIQLLIEKQTQPTDKEVVLKSAFIGKICIVRTYSAGVFYGKIEEKAGKEVRMSDARRIWQWAGAASLSQLATQGTSSSDKCKFPTAVAQLELTEVIEVIPLTNLALCSLNGVPEWKI
jgi:hypothetical protein